MATDGSSQSATPNCRDVTVADDADSSLAADNQKQVVKEFDESSHYRGASPLQNYHFSSGDPGPTQYMPNTWFLGPTQVHNPNGISIGSPVSTQLNKRTQRTRTEADNTDHERRVPELIPVLGSYPAGDVSHIHPAVGCHYFPPGPQLPPQPLRGLLPISLLGEQRHDVCEQFA